MRSFTPGIIFSAVHHRSPPVLSPAVKLCFLAAPPSLSKSAVSEDQMSPKTQQAKTKADLRNLLSHSRFSSLKASQKWRCLSVFFFFSCFVSACPSSSNNQRPEPLRIPCQRVTVYCCTLFFFYSARPFFFFLPFRLSFFLFRRPRQE